MFEKSNYNYRLAKDCYAKSGFNINKINRVNKLIHELLL